jgi:Cu/Ag efflux protein CusF
MPHKFLSILLLVFALCACKDKHTVTPIERYQLDGVIVSVNPQADIVKVDGKAIEGWMEAMTMEYPVKDKADLDSLHAGDHITATVFVQGLNYSIGEIHHVR